MSGFLFDGSDRGNAGEIEQNKHQKAESAQRCDAISTHGCCNLFRICIFVVAVKNAQCAGNKFFGAGTCYEADPHLPIESAWLNGWFNGFANLPEI